MLRILLAEDNAPDANLIKEYASGYDVQFDHAETLEKVLEFERENRYDLTLMDLNLLDSSGADTLRSFRAQNRHVPVIVTTGMESEEIERECTDLGANRVIHKNDLPSFYNSLFSISTVGYFYPLSTILQDWQPKLLISILGAITWGWLDEVFGLYSELFSVDPLLIAGAFFLWLSDFLSGLYRAYQNRMRITAKKMRQSVVKLLEYALMVAVLVVVSNQFSDTVFDIVTGTFDEVGLLFVSLTELKSVLENIYGEEKARRIWKRLGAMWKWKDDPEALFEEGTADSTSPKGDET